MPNALSPAVLPRIQSGLPTLSLESLTRRIDLLRWMLPAGLLTLVIGDEVILQPWVNRHLGSGASAALSILIYGTVGPLLACCLLSIIGRWVEERETSALQSQALQRAHSQMEQSHDLSDEALQALFATSVLLRTLPDRMPDLSPETAAYLSRAQREVEEAMAQLYQSRTPATSHASQATALRNLL